MSTELKSTNSTGAGVSGRDRATLIKIQETGWRSEQCGVQFAVLVVSRLVTLQLQQRSSVGQTLAPKRNYASLLFKTRRPQHYPTITTRICNKTIYTLASDSNSPLPQSATTPQDQHQNHGFHSHRRQGQGLDQQLIPSDPGRWRRPSQAVHQRLPSC